jgi:hypothetical protein
MGRCREGREGVLDGTLQGGEGRGARWGCREREGGARWDAAGRGVRLDIVGETGRCITEAFLQLFIPEKSPMNCKRVITQGKSIPSSQK